MTTINAACVVVVSRTFTGSWASNSQKRITEFHRQLGFSNFVTLLHFGTLSRELTEKNIRRFASDVLPGIQQLGDNDYAGYQPQKEMALQ